MLKLLDITITKNGKNILDQLSLTVFPREIHSILGQNGTGKSTLAYAIMGLPDYRIHSGQMLWQGENITSLSVTDRAKLGITLAWQEPVRFEGLRVKDYLEIGSRTNGRNLTPAQSLESVGLNPDRYLHREVDATLSGGERKRIELAAVLMMQPRLAILDEPDSGIDALSIDYIKGVIRTLVARGSSVLLITHHEQVAAMADRASSLCAGKILKTGSPEEVTRFFRNHCQECPHVNQPAEEVIQNA
jgi:Fe-S cluster assembly ATP-binding protein